MSDRSSEASDDGDSYDEYKAWENECLARVPALPREVQDIIITFCDMDSLNILCQVNWDWHHRALPVLWGTLDFSEAQEDSWNRHLATRPFFATCDRLMTEEPEKFAKLAAGVHTLDVGRLYGTTIVQEDEADNVPMAYYNDDAAKRNVFDVIAAFPNLQHLAIYVKTWWGFGSLHARAGKALASNLTKLKSLKIGGEVPPNILKGLVAHASNLTDMTLINLIESPGQDNGPEPVIFLTEEMCKKFTNLETLHLVKLADLHGRDDDEDDDDDDSDGSEDERTEYDSGMRWRFPREEEIDLLSEWAMLLRHTSKTIRSLTLENRWLCSGHDWDHYRGDTIEPGKGHPEHFGKVSIRETQRVLFAALFTEEWPKLEELTLAGLGTEEAVNSAVAHLAERVTIKQRAARYQMMGGDATPEDISTPYEFGSTGYVTDAEPQGSGAEDDGSDNDAEDDDDEGEDEMTKTVNNDDT